MKKVNDAELRNLLHEIFMDMELDKNVSRVEDEYPDRKSVYVEYNELSIFLPEKYHSYLFEHPTHFFEQADKAIEAFLSKDNENFDLHFRVIDLPDVRSHKIREIKKSQLYNLITVEGQVGKTFESVPEITMATFKCQRCGGVMTEEQDGVELEEPLECVECGKSSRKTNFVLKKEQSEYVDYQKITIQDLPQDLEGGEEPQTLDCWIRDDIVDQVSPGSHVRINGIIDSKMKNKKSKTMDIYMRVNSIEVMEEDFEEMDLTEDDIEKIEELGDNDNILDMFRNSIAPTIHGHKHIKTGMALQSVGGVRKEQPDGTITRGDIHILLVGDPGTAKSQLIRYMSRLSPRGMLSSGKGTTEAGLTAAATREEVFGESKWTLQAGTVVLADKGLAAIDELDKMRKGDRDSIHEAMEQQTVSIDKASIHATLPARCSILAASNPETGRFIPEEKVTEQIGLGPTLLSRFDLIYPITDTVDKERDKQLANHIADTHIEGQKMAKDSSYEPQEDFRPDIELDLLKKYISYAKTIVPIMSEEAKKKIVDFYTDMRMDGEDRQSGMPITPRQQESLIRMAEASARLHLREDVTGEDAEIAINTMKYFLNEVASTEDGLDIDMISSEYSHKERTESQIIMDIVGAKDDEYEGEGVPKEKIIAIAKKEGIMEKETESILEKKTNDGQLYEPTFGRYAQT